MVEITEPSKRRRPRFLITTAAREEIAQLSSSEKGVLLAHLEMFRESNLQVLNGDDLPATPGGRQLLALRAEALLVILSTLKPGDRKTQGLGDDDAYAVLSIIRRDRPLNAADMRGLVRRMHDIA